MRLVRRSRRRSTRRRCRRTRTSSWRRRRSSGAWHGGPGHFCSGIWLWAARAQRPVACSVAANEQYNTRTMRGRRPVTARQARPEAQLLRETVNWPGRLLSRRHLPPLPHRRPCALWSRPRLRARARNNIITTLFGVSWLRLSCATGSPAVRGGPRFDTGTACCTARIPVLTRPFPLRAQRDVSERIELKKKKMAAQITPRRKGPD